MNLDLREIPFYYINLDDAVERRTRTENHLKALGIKSINRIPAVRHSNGFAGCARTVSDFLHQITEGPFVLIEDDIEVKQWDPIIEVPDDADALYLGISGWGRMNGHSGPFVQWKQVDDNLLRVYNMLSGHAIVYLSGEWVEMARRCCHHAGYVIESYYDVQIAEVQRFFNVYALDDPYFYQTSSDGNQKVTYEKLSTQQSLECLSYVPQLFLPERIN
jgi:hypothetical protein